MNGFNILWALAIGGLFSPLLTRCIDRMPDDQKLWNPPLHCSHCSHVFPKVSNIPLLGFFLHRRHCSACLKPLEYQPLLIEVMTLLGTLAIFLWRDEPFQIAIDLVFLYALLVVAMIDWNHMIIEPRVIVLALSLRLLWLAWFDSALLLYYLGSMFIAAGAFYFISFIYEMIRDRQGLGEGDAAVIGLVGLWGGWEMLSLSILAAALSGLLFAVPFLLYKKEPLMSTHVPFAPSLCFGGGLVYFLKEFYGVSFTL